MADNEKLWDKFDREFDTEELQKDVEEAAENGGNYKEVPLDTYEVKITKLELGETKKSEPKLVCWMKILEGEYKGSMLFMNQPIGKGYGMHKANEFVRALVAEMEEPINVVFKTFNQYGNMLMDVAEAIDNNFEYKVRYGESKGFNTFDVEEVYILED